MYPHRIVCLTEETTETLYLLGEGDRVVGVSGYTVRPPEARKKPRVSAFINADFDKIEALCGPTLIFAFSDLQADIAAELVRRGYPVVHVQSAIGGRDPADDARWSAASSARADRARTLVAELQRGPRGDSRDVRPRMAAAAPRLLRGMGRPADLGDSVGRGAGRDCRRRRRSSRSLRPKLAKDRIVDPAEVVRRDPEIIVASWCGKPVRPRTDRRTRAGWEGVAAVRDGQIHEIKSAYILQPGPAALTEGVRQLHAIVSSPLDESFAVVQLELGAIACDARAEARAYVRSDLRRSVREHHVHRRNQALFRRLAQQPQHGRPSALAVVEREVVDVHPDERIGLLAIQAAAVLHRVRDGVGSVVEAVRDAVVKQTRQARDQLRTEVAADDVAAKRQRQPVRCAPPTTRRSRPACAVLPARR